MVKRTYTVVFMKVIGNNYPIPDYQRQYKNKASAYRAMSRYYAHTGFEAFIVRGDNRDSHKKKVTFSLPENPMPAITESAAQFIFDGD